MIKKYIPLAIAVVLMGSNACKNAMNRSDECRTFWKSVKEDWTFDPETNVYRVNAKGGRKNMDFVHGLLYDHANCWKGIQAKQIRRYFGEPSKSDGGQWDYYLDSQCFDRNGKDCNYFSFVLNEDSGLMKVELNAYSTIEN